ncbi:ABC transporter substrate-binding protein [Balneatrix alpica]|uniref:ABC transporter substrate-binding protein n=1 Tax=Balneatrix alpica TaxID=75684 RepID=A0ABV5Z7R1_9GAMM|nr:ABC transporter substrate-binding protein [Balneatrix alpica]
MLNSHLLRFLLSLLLCWPLLGFAHHPADTRITFINPGHREKGFWKDVSDTMQAAAEQLGFALTIHSSNREWPTMLEHANRVIQANEPPDILILVNEHQQAAELVAAANQRGIKTFLLLNNLTAEQIQMVGEARQQLPHWLGSLTPDNRRAGYEMAHSLLANLPPHQSKHPLALLSLAGDYLTPASLQRLEGLDDAIGHHPDLVEQRRLTAQWSFEQAYNLTRLWLIDKQPLGAIWAANDDIALGAIKALEEADIQPGKQVKVCGLNWSRPALEAVQQGKMTLTHGGHFLAGGWSMVLLYDYLHGADFATPSPHQGFAMTAIDQDNVGDFLATFAERDWQKISFSRFSRALHPEISHYDFSLPKLLAAARR